MGRSSELEYGVRRKPTHDEFVAVWERWDAKPGNEDTARAMEAACRAYAGPRTLWFRRELAAARRGGLTMVEALRYWDFCEAQR